MKAQALAALLSLLSIPALADFNGTWEGVGAATTAGGFETPCSLLLKVKQTSKTFEIVDRELNCGFFQSKWLKIRIEIRGTGLWLVGGQYGTIEGGKIQALNWPGAVLKDGSIIRSHVSREDFVIERTEKGVSYVERWVDEKDTVTHLKIEGLLKK